MGVNIIYQIIQIFLSVVLSSKPQMLTQILNTQIMSIPILIIQHSTVKKKCNSDTTTRCPLYLKNQEEKSFLWQNIAALHRLEEATEPFLFLPPLSFLCLSKSFLIPLYFFCLPGNQRNFSYISGVCGNWLYPLT